MSSDDQQAQPQVQAPDFTKWGPDEVEAWINMAGMDELTVKFKQFGVDNGPALHELWRLRNDSVETFFAMLANMKIKNPGLILKLTSLLRSFFEGDNSL